MATIPRRQAAIPNAMVCAVLDVGEDHGESDEESGAGVAGDVDMSANDIRPVCPFRKVEEAPERQRQLSKGAFKDSGIGLQRHWRTSPSKIC